MELFGLTRIYGVKMIDSETGREYFISPSVRDLYDTICQEGDKVKFYLETSGPSNIKSLVRIKSIIKSEGGLKCNVYRYIDIFGGINEEVTGNDSSVYFLENTRIKINGVIFPANLIKASKNYEVLKMEIDNPDVYSIQLYPINKNMIISSVYINGLEVMIK